MMHNPPHPGEVLKELYVAPLALSVTELAKALNIARKTLSAILNGHAGISPLMAIKLSTAFDTTPESWLELQNQYDLWHEQKRMEISSAPTIKQFFHCPVDSASFHTSA